MKVKCNLSTQCTSFCRCLLAKPGQTNSPIKEMINDKMTITLFLVPLTARQYSVSVLDRLENRGYMSLSPKKVQIQIKNTVMKLAE